MMVVLCCVAVDTAAYELLGKQPVLYLPPPPEHPPPSDIGSPPDSPTTDPRYPGRRLLHSDCEPSSPAQRRSAHRYATTTAGPKPSRAGLQRHGGRAGPPLPPSGVAASRSRFVGGASADELHPTGWNNDSPVYEQHHHLHHHHHHHHQRHF